MKFNYTIYEISIKQSIIHTLKEISDVIGKPDLKYPTYRGQHKNGAINVEDISYMGSGSDLKVIRKYFCARDTTKYSIEDIFNFKILDQGYKTQGEINMAETQAIVEQVEDGESVSDTTLNGNNGPGFNGSVLNEQEPAPYGYHDDGKTPIGLGGDDRHKFAGGFSSRHFRARQDRFWLDQQVDIIKEMTGLNSWTDVAVLTVKHFIANPPDNYDIPTITTQAKSDGENHQIIAQGYHDMLGKLIQ